MNKTISSGIQAHVTVAKAALVMRTKIFAAMLDTMRKDWYGFCSDVRSTIGKPRE